MLAQVFHLVLNVSYLCEYLYGCTSSANLFHEWGSSILHTWKLLEINSCVLQGVTFLLLSSLSCCTVVPMFVVYAVTVCACASSPERQFCNNL